MSAPVDLPDQSPTPLLPIGISDLIIEIPETTEFVSFVSDQAPRNALLAEFEHAPGNCTHNQAQAILGIWRL